MSLRRQISFTAALRDMRNDRAVIPTGFLGARSLIETLARVRGPLVVAGAYDRTAIMIAATHAAKSHQRRHGSTWAEAMSVCLKAAWQTARNARPATAH